MEHQVPHQGSAGKPTEFRFDVFTDSSKGADNDLQTKASHGIGYPTIKIG